jgi:hypothetical protein
MYNISYWTGLVSVSGKGNLINQLNLEMLFVLGLSSSAAVVNQHGHQPNVTERKTLKREMIGSQPRNPPSKMPLLLWSFGHEQASLQLPIDQPLTSTLQPHP